MSYTDQFTPWKKRCQVLTRPYSTTFHCLTDISSVAKGLAAMDANKAILKMMGKV